MVKSVSHKFKNVDVCTTVVISAGLVKFKEANVSISIPTPTTSSAVINQALLQMKLPSNLSTMAIDEKKYKQYSYSGSATALLDNTAKEAGLNWKIDQDKVVFYSTSNKANFLQISPLTNLIGSPEIVVEKEEATTVDVKASITKTLGGGKLITKKKYNIQTRLSPNSKIGDIVNVSSKVFGENKTFKILSLVHIGDNRDGKFMTEHVVQELANGTQK
jgi:hypothetical protein